MQIKFFAKDIISGKANKAGDKFVAMFMGQKAKFVVEEIYGDMIMAEFA